MYPVMATTVKWARTTAGRNHCTRRAPALPRPRRFAPYAFLGLGLGRRGGGLRARYGIARGEGTRASGGTADPWHGFLPFPARRLIRRRPLRRLLEHHAPQGPRRVQR